MKVYVRNKMISLGGASTVKDEGGNDILKVKGRMISPTRHKKVCDMNGKVLYKVQNKLIHFLLHSSFIKDAEGHKLMKVKSRFLKPGFDITGPKNEWSIEGQWFSFQSTLMRDGQPIAVVRRNFSKVSDLFRDAFEIECDEALVPFVVAVTIAIDNICDKNAHTRN